MVIRFSVLFSLFIFVQLTHAQQWEATTPPLDFLSDHTFGFALEGMGYLVSGARESIGPSSTFMQYDPVSDSWTTLNDFPGEARGYGIGDMLDGKAYYGFGTSTSAFLNDLWVFDPVTGEWTELAPCPCDGRQHPAFVAHKGKIFMGLGNGNSGNYNDWWEYDIASNSWLQKPDFPGTIRHHPFQFAVGDYVYTGFGHGAGGNQFGIHKDWYQYDPVDETWLQVADIPGQPRVAGTQFSYGNIGYVLSGDGFNHNSMEDGEFWGYDPVADAWTQLASHPGKSRWAPASFIIDGVVYLFNGTSYYEGPGHVYISDAYKFDLEALISSNEEVSAQPVLRFHPNPVQHDLYMDDVEAGSLVQIYNAVGQLVLQAQHHGGAIDVSTLMNGIYLIKSIRDDVVKSGVMIKE